MLTRLARRAITSILAAGMAALMMHATPPGAFAQETPAPDTQPRMTLHARDLPAEQVLARFQHQLGVPIYAKGGVSRQRVAWFSVRDVPVHEALRRLLSDNNWVLHAPEGGPSFYEVWDRESYQATVLPRQARMKTYALKHITSEEAAQAVAGLLTPGIGNTIFDARSNKLFVLDLPYALERVEAMLGHIDVGFITRVFRVSRPDVQEMADKLSRLKSPAASDPVADVRTRQIIVRDTPAAIRKMEFLLETLDYR